MNVGIFRRCDLFCLAQLHVGLDLAGMAVSPKVMGVFASWGVFLQGENLYHQSPIQQMGGITNPTAG